MVINFFKRKNKREIKATDLNSYNSFFSVSSINEMKSNECLNYYYDNCQPLSDAISWVSDSLVGIKIKNFGTLKKSWINTYLLYGNLFLIKLGDTYTIIDNSLVFIDEETGAYEINSSRFYLKFDSFGNGIDNSYFLVHLKNLKTFNARLGSSEVLPIINEIKILINGNLYNSNVLQNGARLDGVLAYKGTMTTEAEAKTKNAWQTFFNGVKNAGKTLFLNTQNGDISYTPMSKSNKDMEFQQLITNCTYAIYKTFKVPLPLIETKVQTYNNYAEAQAQLFDNASEPVATDIIMQLQKILNDPSIEIDMESLPISAKIKSYDVAKRQTDSGIFTINEIRATLGLEPLEGGDILRSSNATPIAYTGTHNDISLYETSNSNENPK